MSRVTFLCLYTKEWLLSRAGFVKLSRFGTLWLAKLLWTPFPARRCGWGVKCRIFLHFRQYRGIQCLHFIVFMRDVSLSETILCSFWTLTTVLLGSIYGIFLVYNQADTIRKVVIIVKINNNCRQFYLVLQKDILNTFKTILGMHSLVINCPIMCVYLYLTSC